MSKKRLKMNKCFLLIFFLVSLLCLNGTLSAAMELKLPKLPKLPDLPIKLPTPFFLLKKNKVIESSDITNIIAKVDRHTLVVFNLDYTLFRPTTYLGTPEWSTHLLHKERKIEKNQELACRRNYALWLKAQQFNEIELMDERIPRILKELKSRALGYMVITNRQGSAFEVTQWQLNKFDIDLIKSPLAGFNYDSQFKLHPAVFREGILFTHNFNNKAEVFLDWLLQIMPQLKKMKSIHRVVFIDESSKDILSMQQAAESLGLDFFGVRYSKADEFRKRFSPKLVEAEKRILMGNHSDSEIRLMLEDIGSYVEHY